MKVQEVVHLLQDAMTANPLAADWPVTVYLLDGPDAAASKRVTRVRVDPSKRVAIIAADNGWVGGR